MKRSARSLEVASSEKVGSFRRVMDDRNTGGEIVLPGVALVFNDMVTSPWSGHR